MADGCITVVQLPAENSSPISNVSIRHKSPKPISRRNSYPRLRLTAGSACISIRELGLSGPSRSDEVVPNGDLLSKYSTSSILFKSFRLLKLDCIMARRRIKNTDQ